MEMWWESAYSEENIVWFTLEYGEEDLETS